VSQILVLSKKELEHALTFGLDEMQKAPEIDGGGVLGKIEQDPLGKKAHEPGAKLDAGKVCVWRGAISYFPRAIEQVAAVSTFGAKKYAWKGWESVPDGINRYSDALGRHLIEEGSGKVLDGDSGLLVAAHSAWNALARLELMLRENSND
jgi:hypothetical protein